jgi:multidrug efflux pump subunit AcrB
MNERIMSGMERFDAIVESSKNRLKPILMTTASTIIGLLPMAISVGKGAGMRRPIIVEAVVMSIGLSLFFEDSTMASKRSIPDMILSFIVSPSFHRQVTS